MSDLGRALLTSLDAGDLDALAAMLADRLHDRLAPDPPTEWIRGAEAIAAYLHCPSSRVYALSSAGRIPVRHDGRHILARRADLDAWLTDGGGTRP